MVNENEHEVLPAEIFGIPLVIGTVIVNVPVKVVSEMNSREHWSAKLKRKKSQQMATMLSLATLGMSPDQRKASFVKGATITFERIGGKRMDDDNLRSAFKHCRDAVAKWLGIDDGSKLLTWKYEQRTRTRKEKAACLEITIEAADAGPIRQSA